MIPYFVSYQIYWLIYYLIVVVWADLLDYKNAGSGLNSWMQNIFKSGSLGFAGGGEVDARQFFNGEDYTNVIAKSVSPNYRGEDYSKPWSAVHLWAVQWTLFWGLWFID